MLGRFRLQVLGARAPDGVAISDVTERATVSVIIPAFNRADTLPHALRSVFAQSLRPAEIIVVDDHSGDGTARVAEELGARVITHEQNEDAAAAHRKGSRRRRTAHGSSTTQARPASSATRISSAAGGHPGHPDFKVNLQARDQSLQQAR